eukprot:5727949-Prymnesium_polylepis.1
MPVPVAWLSPPACTVHGAEAAQGATEATAADSTSTVEELSGSLATRAECIALSFLNSRLLRLCSLAASRILRAARLLRLSSRRTARRTAPGLSGGMMRWLPQWKMARHMRITASVVKAAKRPLTIAEMIGVGVYVPDAGPEYWKQLTSRSHASAFQKICEGEAEGSRRVET